jgi:hypothetical protein
MDIFLMTVGVVCWLTGNYVGGCLFLFLAWMTKPRKTK